MEATDSHIHEKFINFSRSQCRELPKQYSFASKCLMFEDSLKTTKNNRTKGKYLKCIFNTIKSLRNISEDFLLFWIQDIDFKINSFNIA